MTLPNLVFIHSKEVTGGELILFTKDPHFVFRVYKFESYKAKEEFAIKHNVVLDAEHVPGYNILICYVGTIENIREKVVLGHLVPAHAKEILKDTIEFYEKERIKGNETRLKKYVNK